MSDRPLQSLLDTRPTPRKVLVLGSTGMVGRSWVELLKIQNIPYVGVSRPVFDLMKPESIKQCVTGDFDLVVNAAAWTDVDGAESDESGAQRANAYALAEIAQCCIEHDSTLITYSTDYVFSGDANSPYRIDAPINPINSYGRSKALGEQLLSESNAKHILIRTSWVYAPWGSNFVRTIHNLAQTKDDLQVVNDQRGRPTSAQHLAIASLNLYAAGALGFWHVTDGQECTWFAFAREITEYCKLQCEVKPCTSDQYPRPARRPAYSTLDITDAVSAIGILGDWQDHLHCVLDQLKTD